MKTTTNTQGLDLLVQLRNQVDEEVFVTMPNFPAYQISNMGNCYSIRGKKILKPQGITKTKYGTYTAFALRVNGKTVYKYGHILVAEHFIGEIPEGFEVNHINAIRDDNRLINLEILKPSDNVRHGWWMTHGLNARKYLPVIPYVGPDKYQAKIRTPNGTVIVGHYMTYEHAQLMINDWLHKNGVSPTEWHYNSSRERPWTPKAAERALATWETKLF